MEKKTCFVIMPISDNESYDEGHFTRVYEYLIKPAVEIAGFIPVRADDIKKTNYIILDILKRLIESEMAICDLSSRNPNVLYELGIRQAFDKPVTFIKDELTDRVFDIQGFRDFEYNSSLRIDGVEKERERLAEIIKNTYNNENEDVNSIIDLLSITKANIKNEVNISPELSVVLKSIEEISTKITKIQDKIGAVESVDMELKAPLDEFSLLKPGDYIIHKNFGKGKIMNIHGESRNAKANVYFEQHGTKSILLRIAPIAVYKE